MNTVRKHLRKPFPTYEYQHPTAFLIFHFNILSAKSWIHNFVYYQGLILHDDRDLKKLFLFCTCAVIRTGHTQGQNKSLHLTSTKGTLLTKESKLLQLGNLDALLKKLGTNRPFIYVEKIFTICSPLRRLSIHFSINFLNEGAPKILIM